MSPEVGQRYGMTWKELFAATFQSLQFQREEIGRGVLETIRLVSAATDETTTAYIGESEPIMLILDEVEDKEM